MYTYRLNFENHFKNSWTILIYVIGSVLFPFFMVYQKGPSDLLTFVLMGIGLLLLFLIPPIIIHCNYFRINKNDLLIYDPSNQNITINHKGENHSFFLSDISFIERFMSHPLADNRTQWLPWDSYNHSIIHLESGQKFVVTSLLVPNLDLPVGSGKVRVIKTYYKLAPKM